MELEKLCKEIAIFPKKMNLPINDSYIIEFKMKYLLLHIVEKLSNRSGQI